MIPNIRIKYTVLVPLIRLATQAAKVRTTNNIVYKMNESILSLQLTKKPVDSFLRKQEQILLNIHQISGDDIKPGQDYANPNGRMEHQLDDKQRD